MAETDFAHTIEALNACAAGDGPLPGSAYADRDLYRLEAGTLFKDNWIGLTCGQVVPTPGDVFPVTICGMSLLVVRQKDERIRVFYNLCRHRGARLVDDPCKARAGMLVCPYHAWSYRLDGSLAAAPEYARDGRNTQPDVDEKAGLGLIEVPARVWRDIVFIALGDVPRFDDWIEPIDRYLAEWRFDELSPLDYREFSIRANWKLAAENFLDAWHLPVVHPQIGGGFEGALLIEDLNLAPHVIGLRMPIGYGSDSRMEARAFAGFTSLSERNRCSVEVFCIFPNTLILVEPDWQQVITLRPGGPAELNETFADYLALGGDLPEPSILERTFGESARVNEQDKTLLEGQQRSRTMPAGDRTVLSRHWDTAPRAFQRLWLGSLLSVIKEHTEETPQGAQSATES
jgi:choline monooxygenase